MASDYDSESNSEMDLLEMAECILRDFLISSSSDSYDISSDESDEYQSENEIIHSTEDITGSNVTRKCGDTDDAAGNRQAVGRNPAGECVCVTEGILKLCDRVRAMCDDVQQCLSDRNLVPSDLPRSVNKGEQMGNLGPKDLHHSVDSGENMGSLDSSDLQHLVNKGELQHLEHTVAKIGKPDSINLHHSVDTRKKMGNPDPIKLQHSLDTSEKIENLDSIDLQHSVDTSEQIRNLDPSDFQHMVNKGEMVDNPEPIHLMPSVDTGKKMGDLDPTHHSQQDFSASEEEPRHPGAGDLLNEWIEFNAKDENQQKEYREQVLRDLSNAIIPIAKSVLRLCFEQPKCTNSTNKQPSDLEGMDNNAEHSELNFGVIAMALLDPFRSKGETGNESDENTAETAVKEKRCAESTGTDQNGWISWIDGIYELVELYCDIKASNKDSTEDNDRLKNMKEARTADTDGNTDGKKDKGNLPPVTIWLDWIRDVIIDLVKVCLWFYGGCQEVADSSYKADDVMVCNDWSSNIHDLLSGLSKLFKPSVSISEFEHYQLLSDIFLKYVGKLLQIIAILLVVFYLLKPVYSSNIKTESKIKTGSNIKTENNIKTDSKIKTKIYLTWSDNDCTSHIFQFLNWLNDNSSYFTNIECRDTNVVHWLSSWAYSIIMSSNKFNSQWKDMVKLLKNIVQLVSSYALIYLISEDDFTTRLKYIGEIFPHLEYFLRNVTHMYFSWFLSILFSKNLSFTEKNCTFGRRLVKKVSVLELLGVISQPAPSELLTVLKKLNIDFQIRNISSRLKTELFDYEQHDDSVLTQTPILNADIECQSVVDMLWLRYQDTLSQSNWCNAVTDMTKMFEMFIGDFTKLTYHEMPELLKHSESIQFIKGSFSPVLSGSRLDGCVSLLYGPGNACDFDLMVVLFRSDSFNMEVVPDRPTSVVFKTFPGKYPGLNSQNKYYLSPLDIKSQTTSLTFAFVFVFPVFLFLSIVSNIAFSLQQGAVADTLLLFKDKDVILSVDWVPAVVIDSWPDQAQTWIHRNYDWPVFEMRESISRGGCHAVGKTPKGGDPNKEWRLSFSKAENTLCKMFTPSQAFHLSLLKTQFKSLKKFGSYPFRIFKDYIITEGVFHTYHAKTAMFWFCEAHPPTLDIWKKENVFQCQSELLESMEGMMRDGNIPHYFIPEQNLLEDIPAELLQQAVGELRVLKEEVRTGDGRVYQKIIKQPLCEGEFVCWLKQIMSMIVKSLSFIDI